MQVMAALRSGVLNNRVPDAVQRFFSAARRSPGPTCRHTLCMCMGSGLAAHHATKGGVLRCVRGTPPVSGSPLKSDVK
jgi:hypothetical protein